MTDWRSLPTLTALRAFDAMAKHGSFAGAARALNVTNAAIAQQVRALEADLGLRLALRQGRYVQMTEQGRVLARALADGFATISETIDALRAASQNKALRVTTTPFLTDRIIMPRLAEFWTAHPGAEISLFPTRDNVDVVGDGFDLAIRAMVQDGQDFTGTDQVTMGKVGLIGIAAPKLVAERGRDAHGLPWLWHDGMDAKIQLMRACGLRIEDLEQRPIGSPNLLLEATRQGLGVTIFNGPIARHEMGQGGLVEIPLPAAPNVSYVAVSPKGPKHPLAQAFTEWVSALL